MSRSLGLATAALLGVVLVLEPEEARAFDFVEHVELTIEGARSLPPEVRAVIDEGLTVLRHEGGSSPAAFGLEVCPEATSTLRRGAESVCTPYGAWPALAADHHPTEGGLLGAIGGPSSSLVEGATSSQRRRGRALLGVDPSDFDAVAQARSDALRAMDLFQTVHHGWFTENGYVELATRGASHFQAADEAIERQLADLVTEGRVDRALAQALVHHLRSLQLAREWRRTGRGWVLARAFAAHSFALHFAQDAHAAGHAVMTEHDFAEPDARMRRHDYFGFRGLGMTFALAELPCSSNVAKGRAEGWPSPCWTAFGDGNLEGPGRDRAVDSTAQLQLQFAMALEPALAARWTHEAACPPGHVGDEPIALCTPPTDEGMVRAARLLDPHPPWTFPSGFDEPRGGPGCARAALLIATTERALERLDGTHRIVSITTDAPVGAAGVTPVRGVVTAEEIGQPLERCAPPSERAEATAIDPIFDPLCRTIGPGRAFLGSPSSSLLRPILTRWPVPQATAGSLVGEAGNGRGWGWQVLLGGQGTRTLEGSSGYFLFAGFGIAPRFQDLFPQESSFAPVEMNVGLGPTALLPDGVIGAAVFAELRIPLVALLPAAAYDLATNEVAPSFITEIALVPHGFRLAYDVEREAVRWDVELLSAHVPLGSTFLPHRADLLPADLRLRLGRDHGIAAWTFGLELVGGATGMFDGD